MTRNSKKINRTIHLAKHVVRIKRADGGETDPLLDSDTPTYVRPEREWGPAITPEQAFSAPKEEAKPSLVDRAFSTVTGGRNLENDIRNVRERLPDLQQYGAAVQHATDEARRMQQLGVENMKSGEVGRSVLGAAQVPLGYFNQAIAPVTGGFELASEAAGRFDPRLKAEADVIGLLGTEGSGALAKATNTARDIASGISPEKMAIFAGVGAKTADLAALEVAKKMAKEGAPREAIIGKTGWFQGADGKWRFEIPDTDYTLGDLSKSATVGEAVTHPKLLEAYPQLANIELEYNPLGSAGAYSQGDFLSNIPPTIKLSKKASDPQSTMLHELQHGVQDIEQFAPGANTLMLTPGSQAYKIYQQKLKQFKEIMPFDEYWQKAGFDNPKDAEIPYKGYVEQIKKPSTFIINDLQREALREAYRRSAGEVEARNVQSRYKIGYDQFPWETQSVPESRQIISKNKKGSYEQQSEPRALTDLGFYSHGAETAAGLPQAKGTADQMISMLRNQGVRPAELEHAGLIDASGAVHPDWAGKPVTREELAQHLQQSMPQVEEKIIGKRMTDADYDRLSELEWKNALEKLSPEEIMEWNALHKKESEDIFSGPKYKDYTIPGGENYREVLLKTPTPMNQYNSYVKELRDKYGPGGFDNLPLTESERIKLDKLINTAGDEGTGGIFRSSHWDDPNVLAHVRMSDRTGPNGEKLLHVEELQSDWGQKGKKKGFKGQNPLTDAERDEFNRLNVMPDHIRTAEENAKLDDFYKRLHANQSGTPMAPYVTSTQGWTDLALKRVMKEAAEGGYDGIVFTPGAEQAERYKLSKQVGKIYYDPDLQGGTLAAEGLNGQTILDKAGIKPENVAEYIGKEAAEKLLKQERDLNGHHVLEGDGLKIGGEGMKGYYDQIVPKRLQELVKQHDKEAKLSQKNINFGNEGSLGKLLRENGYDPNSVDIQEILSDHGGRLPRWLTESDADSIAAGDHLDFGNIQKIPMFHMPMTDKMRQSILSGQKAFAEGGRVGFADGGAPWNIDLSMDQFTPPTLPQSNVPLATMDLYKGAAPNPTPTPQQETPQETPAAPMTMEQPAGEGSSGAGMGAGANPGGQSGQPGGQNNTQTSSGGLMSSLADVAGYGPGMTVGNTIGGIVGGVLGSVVGGPVGGLLGGTLGRHAANALASDEDTDTDEGDEDGEDDGGDEGGEGNESGAGTSGDGSGDGSGEGASSGEGSAGDAGGGGKMDGGAITMRRYRAAGGPIKITPAQASAGNYKKKHVNFQGLPVAIETPKGHIREKVVNGEVHWRVKMPSDYGYVKGTKDNDGDATDVFLGPNHKSGKVWLIDQADTKTGKFDEHKAMLGFDSKKQAMDTYIRSFSDGKGKRRVMNTTEMSVDQYKNWVKNGDLKKPVSSNALITKALMVASKKS